MAAKLRTVVFDRPALTAIVNLYGGAELADEACRGFEFILARSPEAGIRLNGNEWMIEMEGVGVWETVTCFYTFDSDTVTVHDAVVP